jgi:hypothetical protein
VGDLARLDHCQQCGRRDAHLSSAAPLVTPAAMRYQETAPTALREKSRTAGP